MVITLAGFITGATIATFHMPFWWNTPSWGPVMLGEQIGWIAAITSQLLLFAIIVWISWRIERRFRPMPVTEPPAASFWQVVLRGPWPLLSGAIGLAVLNGVTLLLAGHPWSITWAFSLWGGKALQATGYDLSQTLFWRGAFQQQALLSSILSDTTSVMNLGLVLGAGLAAGLAGRFLPSHRLSLRVVGRALLGGLLLGYGARIAYGCNIGAYFSGIASTSLHGWLWLVGALLGTPFGIRLRTLLRG
jgi:hypothetical protein